MELKWLEDLISVAEKGHFGRAAEARNITQSAFSRRIKSLELWLGTELLDRSQHPVSLTPAGEDFYSFAQNVARMAYQARAEATKYERIANSGVTISCLHTLALFHVPSLVAKLRDRIGPFEASIVAEARAVDEYLESLYNGTSDFFIAYRHSASPLTVDLSSFLRIDFGEDRMLPYLHSDLAIPDLASASGPAIPYLEFSGTSFMSHVVTHIISGMPARKRLRTVYRGTLAESLSTAALGRLGLAWLPESVVEDNPRTHKLRCLDSAYSAPMTMSIFKAASNNRPVVERIWDQFVINERLGGLNE